MYTRKKHQNSRYKKSNQQPSWKVLYHILKFKSSTGFFPSNSYFSANRRKVVLFLKKSVKLLKRSRIDIVLGLLLCNIMIMSLALHFHGSMSPSIYTLAHIRVHYHDKINAMSLLNEKWGGNVGFCLQNRWVSSEGIKVKV